MKLEYATTCARTERDQWHSAVEDYPGVLSQPAPSPPPGDGWEMCGAAAGDYALFWFWRRAVAVSAVGNVNSDLMKCTTVRLGAGPGHCDLTDGHAGPHRIVP